MGNFYHVIHRSFICISSSVLENMGPKHRSDIYLISGLGWLVGYCLIPLIAYYIRDFRYMHWAMICPLICMVCWLYLMSESPRWLITSGKTKRGERVLRRIVRQNNMSEENFDEKYAELLQHLQLVWVLYTNYMKIFIELNVFLGQNQRKVVQFF